MAASKLKEAAIFLYQRHIYETKGQRAITMSHFYYGYLFAPNALFLRRFLKKEEILLITSAMHMPRSIRCFEFSFLVFPFHSKCEWLTFTVILSLQ
jgi:hypothetical protein